jgi:hypothetical protein
MEPLTQRDCQVSEGIPRQVVERYLAPSNAKARRETEEQDA